uniref:C-factor n=1 Tax=Ditylenchus dipsaci TaxID=166011 RepID=A0A915D2J7_9BILA
MSTTNKLSNILITGANRGIGLGLVVEFAKCPDIQHIFACCRQPKQALELEQLQKSHSSIQILELDVSNDKSIADACKQVTKTVPYLNLLINNAGICDQVEGVQVHKPDRDLFLRHFNVNTVGPVMVNGTFLPLLRNCLKVTSHPAIVINVSSEDGSISLCQGSYPLFSNNAAYGMSKAALNHYSKALAFDEKEVIWIALDPGWVRTDMGKRDHAPLSVEESCSETVKLVAELQKKDSGRYVHTNGKTVPY